MTRTPRGNVQTANVRVTIDANRNVAESNESNNVFEQNIYPCIR
jgi:subtilase family serine protease